MRDTYWTRQGISTRDPRELNTVAARLILDLLPGLELSVLFHETDGLIHKLFAWAEKGQDPLQSYAIGLVAAAMELQDIAANFREQNAHLVPIMLKRLWEIQKKSSEEKKKEGLLRRFPKFNNDDEMGDTASTSKNKSSVDAELMPGPVATEDKPNEGERVAKVNRKKCANKTKASNAKVHNQANSSFNSSLNASLLNDSSNSSWAEMEQYVIGMYIYIQFFFKSFFFFLLFSFAICFPSLDWYFLFSFVVKIYELRITWPALDFSMILSSEWLAFLKIF